MAVFEGGLVLDLVCDSCPGDHDVLFELKAHKYAIRPHPAPCFLSKNFPHLPRHWLSFDFANHSSPHRRVTHTSDAICDVRLYLSSVSHLLVIGVRAGLGPPSMASSILELWDMLLHVLGCSCLSQLVRQLCHLGKQCHRLRALVV